MEIIENKKDLIGLATILVLLAHVTASNYLIQLIRPIGQIGVDIFFILAGIGCYNSLRKNGIKEYYKHRALRIIPSYLIIYFARYVYRTITANISFAEFFKDNNLLSFFINDSLQDWFVSAILIIYLVFPLIYRLSKKKWFKYIIVLSFVWIVLPRTNVRDYFLCRIPLFLIGVLIAKEGRFNFFGNEGLIWFFSFTLFFYFSSNIILLRLLSTIIAILIIHGSFSSETVSKLGDYSYESYLLNENIISLIPGYSLIMNIIQIVVTISAAIVLKQITEIIITNISK